MGLAVVRHGVSEPQRRALAIRKQRTGLVSRQCAQRFTRQLRLAPEMPAPIDAPAAAAALGGELRHEQAELRTEIGAAVALAGEGGLFGPHARGGRDRPLLGGTRQRSPDLY